MPCSRLPSSLASEGLQKDSLLACGEWGVTIVSKHTNQSNSEVLPIIGSIANGSNAERGST